MKILVIDVAAEHSGALTVLNQFIEEFKNDYQNEYYVILSKLEYPDFKNVHFIRFEWVKHSRFHRLYFDSIYIKKIINIISPDLVLSLQNKAVNSGDVPQDVYFHNLLLISEKKFSLRESKNLWLYQNIIGKLSYKSLKKVRYIIVQADWIKKELAEKWKIDEKKIHVKQPINCFPGLNIPECRNDSEGCNLFYPANGSIYKNHLSLLKACARIWDKDGVDCGLILT